MDTTGIVHESDTRDEVNNMDGVAAEHFATDEFMDEAGVAVDFDVVDGAHGLDVEDEEVFAEARADVDNAVMVTGSDIVTDQFGDLQLPSEMVEGVQMVWNAIIDAKGSREAAGDGLYDAFLNAAPSLRHLFTTPKAVVAMRFMNSLSTFITNLSEPGTLKGYVETLAFGHLDKDVTVPRGVTFRDALVNFVTLEAGHKVSENARTGFVALLNYILGSFIYIKASYGVRLKLLSETWALANDSSGNKNALSMGSQEAAAKNDVDQNFEGEKMVRDGESTQQNIPTTYKEMFTFNAAVMGFGSATWMNEVLDCFDNIVNNISNSNRLQEEAAVLVLRIAKVATGKVTLSDYKSCMLASLRSLLPKDWTTQHEEAWSWLWAATEKLLLVNMGKTQQWERAFSKLLDSVDEASAYQLRQNILASFFTVCPEGEGYFKQSNTYLHMIVSKVITNSILLYQEPVKTVDEVSGIGLRHVGYGIPTHLFGPWTSVCIEGVQGISSDPVAVEGFGWSLAILAKMMVRTILEGSTIVMRAINSNSSKGLVKAVGVAPRGERATWMLMVRVGTQDISPFRWAIQSGAFDAASAILNDLMTIRADRDRYYYAAEELFRRHPNLVEMLLEEAPPLVPQVLDGLVWRSRLTVDGLRRVNYYIKYILVDTGGNFNKALPWVVRAKDPKLVVHPILAMLSDVVWTRVACRSFITRKLWFMTTLIIFVTCQAVMANLEKSPLILAAIFGGRAFIYLFSMCVMLQRHIFAILSAYRMRDTVKLLGKLPVPTYLMNWQESASLVLLVCLLVMLLSEPILRCLGEDDTVYMFTHECSASVSIRFFPYSTFSMVAMFLYYVLLIDLAVFSNRVSAYVLVCGRMLTEVKLCLLGLGGVILTFSSGMACLDQTIDDFHGVQKGGQALAEMILKIYSHKKYTTLREEPFVLAAVFIFLVIASLFLINLLIAQISCAYDTIYEDMVGYARMKRVMVIVESMPGVSPKRWEAFKHELALERRIEFNEGDVGVAGGIQVKESASANPTTIDIIKRFGGSTSPTIQWPEEDNADDDSDKFERLETLIKRTMDRVAEGSGKGGNKKMASSSGLSGGGGGSGLSGGGGGSGIDVQGETEDGEPAGDHDGIMFE
jgi:uncharacterized membrane protein YgcG